MNLVLNYTDKTDIVRFFFSNLKVVHSVQWNVMPFWMVVNLHSMN